MTGTDPGEVTKTLCMSGLTDTLSGEVCRGLCCSGRGCRDECSICGFSESTQFKVLILNWMSVIFCRGAMNDDLIA